MGESVSSTEGKTCTLDGLVLHCTHRIIIHCISETQSRAQSDMLKHTQKKLGTAHIAHKQQKSISQRQSDRVRTQVKHNTHAYIAVTWCQLPCQHFKTHTWLIQTRSIYVEKGAHTTCWGMCRKSKKSSSSFEEKNGPDSHYQTWEFSKTMYIARSIRDGHKTQFRWWRSKAYE